MRFSITECAGRFTIWDEESTNPASEWATWPSKAYIKHPYAGKQLSFKELKQLHAEITQALNTAYEA